MHIVFDLQAFTAATPSSYTPDAAANGLGLALSAVRSTARHGHSVSLLVAATDVESVVHIRRQLEGIPGDGPALHIWHPVADDSPWHREANAELYRQLLGRAGADALVFDDTFGRHGHPLAGPPDWLPGTCSAVFLVNHDTRLADLPGDQAIWSEAVETHRLALCAQLRQTPGTVSGTDGLVTPLSLPAGEDVEESTQATRQLIDVLQRMRSERSTAIARQEPSRRRPRLAYVSPLPPARTGIADYSADLIAALATHYEIELVVAQSEVDTSCLPAGIALRSVEWFMEHGGEFERVLYHLGNSAFHHDMPALCARYPGTVVLHDFYLGNLLYDICEHSSEHWTPWAQAFYRSHGYGAARSALQRDEIHDVLARYPVNFEFLRQSRGVIVHSKRACELATQWLPPSISERFRHIPLLRAPVPSRDLPSRRNEARQALGIEPTCFLVCCFGIVGKAKANLEILQAWLNLDAKIDGLTELVFVGANDETEYGEQLLDAIAAAGAASSRIRLTGWIGKDVYDQYLQAADAAVQLRTIDRGETSAAALDCMNHGLATIVNANGSMAELPPTAVCMIPAECSVHDIADALIALHGDPIARKALALRGAELVDRKHAPAACAEAYRDVLENDFHRHAAGFWQAAVPRLAQLPGTDTQDRETLAVLSNATASTLPDLRSARQLLVDVSAIWSKDLKTGIQRVVRALLIELIQSPPPGWRIEPVYLSDRTGSWRLLYATQYAHDLLGLQLPQPIFPDDVVEAGAGDMFLGLDFAAGYIIEAEHTGLFDGLRKRGVALHFVVYDLLPILRPEVFPETAHAAHERWLRSVLKVSDGVSCISEAVGSELRLWMGAHAPQAYPRINAFHLGADVMSSAPSYGMPADAPKTLAALELRPTFLAVGTIEPRKGIAQILAAFELLWQQGVDANLVLVGKPGWEVDVLVKALKNHQERGRRLFWLAGISDEYLERVYSHATCLLAASEAEGFGLPLIEAAQKGLPILARDIPVFREVAGDHAFYFGGVSAESLALAVQEWLELHRQGRHPTSLNMPWLTWRQSAQQLSRSLGL